MQTIQMIVFSMKRHFFQSVSIMLCAILCMSVLATPICADAKEPVVVVLDPGHGGESEGAAYNGIFEKDINLSVALMAGYY
ncbi:MAG: N-acetylmuramoyl-L-alanine amidase, partial [Lachnospiraceae bacterium]|nr:N-acetylmuramoyl-L-alanine amidase [Lachnospiraceae bacterium]